MLDILVIAAHPDDAELSLGGTIAKLDQDGYRVGILDLTDGEPTPHGDHEMRMKEAERAKEILGIEFRENLGLENRYLEDNREARERTAEVIRTERPAILLTHFPGDIHPDHAAAAEICKFARFYAKLTKTEMKGESYYPPIWFNFFAMHLRRSFKPSFIFDISEAIEVKLEAIRVYQSQFGPNTSNREFTEFIRNFNRFWGSRIGVEYGEPIYSPEELGLKGLTDLAKVKFNARKA